MNQKSKKIFTRINICIAVVIIFGVYITCISEYNYLKIIKYDSEIKDLKMQIAATREKIVREEYFMKRDNEDVYIVKEK